MDLSEVDDIEVAGGLHLAAEDSIGRGLRGVHEVAGTKYRRAVSSSLLASTVAQVRE